MGVKSTVTLRRDIAERKYIALFESLNRKFVEVQVAQLSNKELEDRLEKMNDLLNDGEGFENYLIEVN